MMIYTLEHKEELYSWSTPQFLHSLESRQSINKNIDWYICCFHKYYHRGMYDMYL